MKPSDLLSIGDSSIDTFMTPLETETLCTIDKKQCLIAFAYGEKIPVKNLEFAVGGNAGNNAVGAKRLGINSSIVLTLGDDSIGNLIVEKLKNEGVDMTFVIQQPGTTSNYSTVINYMGERTIFVYHAPRSYEFPVQLPVVPWVYLTSMGESFRPFYNHLTEWFKKNPTVKVAFNPGSWQLREGYDAIKEIIKCGKIPIICGGTGFYIQAITENLSIPKIKPDKKSGRSGTKTTKPDLVNAWANLVTAGFLLVITTPKVKTTAGCCLLSCGL